MAVLGFRWVGVWVCVGEVSAMAGLLAGLAASGAFVCVSAHVILS